MASSCSKWYIPVAPNVISVRSAALTIDPNWRVPPKFRVQIDDDGAELGQPTHGGQFEVKCYLIVFSRSHCMYKTAMNANFGALPSG